MPIPPKRYNPYAELAGCGLVIGVALLIIGLWVWAGFTYGAIALGTLLILLYLNNQRKYHGLR